MGSILSDRDELQARVLYYESLLADMRCIDRKDSSVQDRLEEALEKLKTTQEELILTAKTAASLEAELSTAVRAIEESEVRREKMRVELKLFRAASTLRKILMWTRWRQKNWKWQKFD
eukprot:jgi/Picre1/28103/NNA_003510.t1